MASFFKIKLFRVMQYAWRKWYPEHILVDLEDIHVRNCKVVTSRYEMLKLLPKNAVVAELGVEIGLFSVQILEMCNPAVLHLVDMWTASANYETCKISVAGSSSVSMQKMKSVDFLISQSANSLDWVYIDTDHTYKTTKEELLAAAKVVKDSGFICGHDYTSISYSGLRKYGVVEAVNEFCVSHGYEFVYLTSESNRHISFAIRKINI